MKEKSWTLEDAQKIADEFPYTFYKPSEKVISLLKEGCLVKLIFMFESDDPEALRAERMWVEITTIESDRYMGTLSNDPYHIKDIKI